MHSEDEMAKQLSCYDEIVLELDRRHKGTMARQVYLLALVLFTLTLGFIMLVIAEGKLDDQGKWIVTHQESEDGYKKKINSIQQDMSANNVKLKEILKTLNEIDKKLDTTIDE